MNARYTRHRRRHGRARSIQRAVLVAAAVAMLIALAAQFGLFNREGASTPQSVKVLPTAARAVAVSDPVESRLTYKYSVIPGGVSDRDDLKHAIDNDPVVADHYRGVDVGAMRAVTIRSDRVVHVSYRLRDRVYWTKRPVRIRSGETILTDGQTQIRGRCGNCISMEPLLPTSDEEPDPSELDALTDLEPLLVSWNLNLSGFPATAGGDHGGLLHPSFPIGGVVGVGGPGGGAPTGAGPVTAPPTTFGPTFPGDSPGPPFISVPPFAGGPPGNVPDDPSDPITFLPLLDDPGVPDLPQPPPVPPPLTTVPEPATLWLIGGGLAGMLVRRWRSKT